MNPFIDAHYILHITLENKMQWKEMPLTQNILHVMCCCVRPTDPFCACGSKYNTLYFHFEGFFSLLFFFNIFICLSNVYVMHIVYNHFPNTIISNFILISIFCFSVILNGRFGYQISIIILQNLLNPAIFKWIICISANSLRDIRYGS